MDKVRVRIEWPRRRPSDPWIMVEGTLTVERQVGTDEEVGNMLMGLEMEEAGESEGHGATQWAPKGVRVHAHLL